ncbi:DNA-3-methyladenine glycosylase I [Roseovarius sp. MMSF_3281]|uniref:DNA-3-methyladenine glycosylase I n=1 Tax=Roseovarius sp. MMSF_3281 TaxID=3046694 RepID=UPI00273D6B41|nr:DNA-3-methyladenine glycosylase I [Roseovarius sp. MMSF_3281]
MERCTWAGDDPLYHAYHDDEWGVPEYDSRALWEKLILEGYQAGLSWITILRKRESFREAFQGFDPDAIATWGAAEVEALLQNPGIVRHRGKVEATITNARVWQDIEASQGFADYLWSYVDHRPIQNRWSQLSEVPAQTEISQAISKDLKKRGFKFCGPTITYAFMQAAGLVNDHLTTCPCHEPVADMGQNPASG